VEDAQFFHIGRIDLQIQNYKFLWFKLVTAPNTPTQHPEEPRTQNQPSKLVIKYPARNLRNPFGSSEVTTTIMYETPNKPKQVCSLRNIFGNILAQTSKCNLFTFPKSNK
jgi:hypothetical protein